MTDKHQIIDQAIKFSEEYSKGYEAGLRKAADICVKQEVFWKSQIHSSDHLNTIASTRALEACFLCNEILKELD